MANFPRRPTFSPAEWLPRIEALGYRYHAWEGSILVAHPRSRSDWPARDADIPILWELGRDEPTTRANERRLYDHLIAIGRIYPEAAA